MEINSNEYRILKTAALAKAILLIMSVALMLLWLPSCGREEERDRLGLEKIDKMCNSESKRAILILDSIEGTQKSENERHRYDLLWIKAHDKAYVRHTSDSLILDVIDYYSKHKDSPLFSEALYYGGRVYYDLGDYPQALEYFHKAYEAIPDTPDKLEFKSIVISQTGRLLITLRLYTEALPYVKEGIETSRQMNDTLGIIQDTQLLGGLYLRAENYQEAEKYFQDSYKLSKEGYPRHAAQANMYLAQCYFKTGKINTAIKLIREVPDKVSPVARNGALAYASEMYYQSDYPDTAYMYAKELIEAERPEHKEIGYQVLLSPEVARCIHKDTLLEYVAQYRTILENFYDENENQMAINQQSLYNYGIHVREKEKAKKSRNLWQRIVTVSVFIIMLMGTVLMFMKIRNQRNLLRLHRALDLINDLKCRLEATQDDNDSLSVNAAQKDRQDAIISGIWKNNDPESLRVRLLTELKELSEKTGNIPVSSDILTSPAYDRILSAANEGKMLKDNDPLWMGLQDAVLKCSPDFSTRLNLLTRGKISVDDLHIALLIKSGFRPVQIRTLLSKSNGAIVSRRESIGFKIFDVKVSTKEADGIIRLL